MALKTREDLITEYIKFFKKKDHKEIPSSSLIPSDDPTVLFTTAGMHPLIPFILGQKHPLGKKLVGVQKCIRTGDIDEVGDEVHHTFFEMLGNWSLGEYFKKEAIEYSFEFLTKVLKIKKENLGVSVFEGDKDAPKDIESAKVWESLGIPKERISFQPKKDNWWGPAGEFGPCGPDTEIYCWKSKSKPLKKLDIKDSNWVEIWNDVFMEYDKTKEGYIKAKQKNVDTGMGVERTIAVLNGLEDNYQTSLFLPIIKEIEKLSGKKYKGNEKEMRIIADHIKAAVFMIDDDVLPDHKERGYVLRRLIRRAIVYGKKLDLEDFTAKVAESVFDIYPDYFKKNKKKIRFVGRDNKTFILDEIDREEMKFRYKLMEGLKIIRNMIAHQNKISGKDAFLLFQSYGFPIEMTQELAKENKIKVNMKEFEEENRKHQELSRTASAGVFKSGLADQSEKTKKLHTATHMLDEALRRVLKDENIKQKGSNITPERLRFDFNFPRKLTDDEIKQVEKLINQKIKEALLVKREEMPLKKATESGAGYLPGARYPEVVSVYTIEDKKEKRGFFSKEICTGPHVNNTSELKSFKIIKEESVAAGIRRIKAVLE